MHMNIATSNGPCSQMAKTKAKMGWGEDEGTLMWSALLASVLATHFIGNPLYSNTHTPGWSADLKEPLLRYRCCSSNDSAVCKSPSTALSFRIAYYNTSTQTWEATVYWWGLHKTVYIIRFIGKHGLTNVCIMNISNIDINNSSAV